MCAVRSALAAANSFACRRVAADWSCERRTDRHPESFAVTKEERRDRSRRSSFTASGRESRRLPEHRAVEQRLDALVTRGWKAPYPDLQRVTLAHLNALANQTESFVEVGALNHASLTRT